MENGVLPEFDGYESLPSRGAWIEIWRSTGSTSANRSLPSRGAWIEITTNCCGATGTHVAPLAGSVDRNVSFKL